MSTRAEALLWGTQRLAASVLAIAVLVHLGTIIYAVRGGLTASDILNRTQGSAFWFWFYGIFVAAAAIHGPIGMRTVLLEWTRWRGLSLDVAMLFLAIFLAWFGWRAVGALV